MKYLISFLIIFCSLPALAQLKYDAVIVGENVNIRSEANIKNKILYTLNTGDVVNIISKTDKRTVIPLSNDICDKYGYYWYKVKGTDGQPGWVYGAFLYIVNVFNNKYFENLYSSSLSVGGKEFYYDFAEANSFSISDETGLTNCDELKIPFLYIKNDARIYPFKLLKPSVNISYPFRTTKDNNWLLLTSGRGISETTSTLQILNNTLILLIKRKLQEGGADALFKLTLKDGYFEAVLIYYQTY
jgi:hypothetical protein